MSKTNSDDNVISKIESQVDENHKKILAKEQIHRDFIDSKVEYAKEAIESNKRKYKSEINEIRKNKDEKYNKIEKELDKAIEEGDVEQISLLTDMLELVSDE